MDLIIQHIITTHPSVMDILENDYGLLAKDLLVRVESWDILKTILMSIDNDRIATVVGNLNNSKDKDDIERISRCENEIKENDSWLHPIVLLDVSSIPWSLLSGAVSSGKCPFLGKYFMLDGNHRIRALLNLCDQDKQNNEQGIRRSTDHKVAFSYMHKIAIAYI